MATQPFNLETVRNAWDERMRADRNAARAARAISPYSDYDPLPYTYCREVWSEFIIVERGGSGKGVFTKYPFTVAKDGTVTFGDAKPVKQEYVALSAPTAELLWKEETSAVDNLVALAGKGKKPPFFKKTDEKAQDTEGGSTQDAPAEEGGDKKPFPPKKPAADTASKGSEAGGEETLESIEAWLKEHEAEKDSPAYKAKAAKAESLRGKTKKVGLSALDAEDSAIVRLTRKM